MSDDQFDTHQHDAIVHEHEHWHVTHNWNESTRSFDHLAARHVHEHDHASVEHAHLPHRDVEHEHQGEAHVHDHDEPVDATAGAMRGTSG